MPQDGYETPVRGLFLASWSITVWWPRTTSCGSWRHWWTGRRSPCPDSTSTRAAAGTARNPTLRPLVSFQQDAGVHHFHAGALPAASSLCSAARSFGVEVTVKCFMSSRTRVLHRRYIISCVSEY